MRRAWAAALAGVVIAGIAGLLVTAATDERDLAFTLGVQPAQVAAVLNPGQEACQQPIYASDNAADVRFKAGTYGRPGPPLEVKAIHIGASRATSVSAGYPDNSFVTAPLDGVRKGGVVGVCIRNAGKQRLALYGGAPQAARTSAAFVDGKNVNTDLTLVFERAHSRSTLSALPDIFQRAALWHPGWVGVWTFWVLLVLVLIGVPLLLWRALATSE